MELRYDLFAFVRVLTWEQVLGRWAQQEFSNDGWRAAYESQGKTWYEWRRPAIQHFGLDRLQWQLLYLRNPSYVVPRLHGAEHPEWVQAYYRGEWNPTFAWMARHSSIASNQGVQRARGEFPRQSTIIAVDRGGSGHVVDGMHRCSGIAAAALEGLQFCGELFLAIGQQR